MFLGEGGIAKELMARSYHIKGWGEEKHAFSCNTINFSLLFGEDAIKNVGRFYSNLLKALYLLPTNTRRFFRKALLLHLLKLAKDSIRIPKEYNPCIQLYVEMMFLSKELREEIQAFMEYEFTIENPELNAFKKEVRKVYYKRSFRETANN